MLSLDCKKILKHSLPQGAFILFFVQLFLTMSFSVLYSTLVLYLTEKFDLSVMQANLMVAVFIALNFSQYWLGGYLGGRYFFKRILFGLGLLTQLASCVLLARFNEKYFGYALALFTLGCSFYVTCINVVLTQSFRPQDSRRETSFLWNYAGMNSGFFIGFGLSGYFELLQNYQRLFLFSWLGSMAALFLCLYFWQACEDKV